jgi:Tfp pilus assembly protein PilF
LPAESSRTERANEAVASVSGFVKVTTPMKYVLLLCVLFALCEGGLPKGLAATDPGDRFLEAYFLIQDGDAAERQSDWVKADTKFSAALNILSEIRKENPDWNTHIIEFRTRYCNQQLASIKTKLPTMPETPTALPASAAEPTQPPVPTEGRQLEQVSGELQRTRNEILQLQQERDALKTQLQSELHKPAPTETGMAQKTLEQLRAMQTAQETLTAKLREAETKAAQVESLHTQLQAAEAKISQLESNRDELNAKLQQALANAPAQPSGEVEDLLKKNAELTAQIAKLREHTTPTSVRDDEKIQLRAELAQTKQVIEELRAENLRLTESEQELVAKLTEADRQLRSTGAARQKGDEIILQLRKENALFREIVDKRLVADEQAIPRPKDNRRVQRSVIELPPAQPVTITKKPGPEQLVATLKAPEAPAKTNSLISPTNPVVSLAIALPPASSPRKLSTEAGASPLTRDLLNEARAAFASKDYDAALAKYNFVLANEPNNIAAFSNIGVIRFQQGRLDEAEEVLRKAIAIAPNDSASRSLLGVIYFRQGKTDEAFNELTRAVALDPRNAEAHNYLGITLSDKGWGAAAEQEIRRAIELNPQYADAHFNLAVMYSRQKTPRYELSRYHYQKALDLGGEHDPQLEALLKQNPAKTKAPAAEQPKIETAQP